MGMLSPQAAPAASDNWPQFRGPNGTGVIADDPGLPEAWSATENVAWRAPIPGLGWSSPIVWGDRVFVTTVVADEDYEGPRTGLYLPAGGADTPPDRRRARTTGCCSASTWRAATSSGGAPHTAGR